MGALPHPQLWSLHPLFTLCFWPTSFSSSPRMQIKEGKGNPLQYSCLENPVDGEAWCRWGHKESDMTERLHFHFQIIWYCPFAVLFCFPLLVSVFSLYFPFRWFPLIHFQGYWFFLQLPSPMINLLKKFFIFVIFKLLAFAADSSIQPFPWEPLKILSLVSLNSLLIFPTTVSQLALTTVSSPKVLSLQTICFCLFVSFMLLYWKQKCCPE